MCSRALATGLATLLLPLIPFVQSGHCQTTYEVSLTTLEQVQVKIALPSEPDRLYMSTAGTGSDDGFAGFVREPKLTCGEKAIVLARKSAEWLPESTNASGPCTMTYNVDLSFTRSKWEVGNEQAGFTDGRGTFLSSKAIFIETPVPGTREVTFIVPPRWKLVSPWSPTNGRYHFEKDQMLQDIIAYGDLEPQISSGAGFKTQLVVFGALQRNTPDVAAMVKDVTERYNSIFPETPPANYVVVLIPGDQADGEAYANGFATTLPAPLDPDEKIIWADTIAHEIFHHWCGGLIKAGNHASLEWFTEGFTEYFANRTLIRAHHLSVEDFLQKAAINIGQYEYFLTSSLFHDVTIEKAGQQKGRNRFGVYASGWVIAFVLDQEIRNASNGKRSLDDLMRALQFKTRTQPLTPALLFSTVEEVAGKSTSDLIQHGVSSRDSLHPESYFPSLGLKISGQDYQAEYYVHLDKKASDASLRRRMEWAGF